MHAMRRPISHRSVRAPRKRRWLAAAGYGALALACLALGALAFLLVAPPLDAVRDRLAADVSARTGRTLTVAGPMSVALFPRVVVSLGDIALLPPGGMAGAPTLTAPSLDVETSLWSLLSRRPRLDRITLHRPTVELAVDTQGRRSWEAAAPLPPPRQLPAAGEPDSKGASPGPAARTTSSRRPRPWAVRLLDGMVRYRDERAGTSYEIGALNIDAAAEAAAGTVTMDGAFVWQGQPFHFSATVDAGRTGDGQLERVALKLAGGPVEVAYGGTLSWRGGVAAEGVLTLQRLAYKDLKIGPATFDVKADAGVIELVLREAELYGGRGQGGLTIDTNSPTPVIAARLKLADVSVLPLLKETASVGWLDGRGSLALDLGAQGFSERQFVETLQGQVQVNVAEGSVTGIDIDRSLRALQRGRLGSVAPRREDRGSEARERARGGERRRPDRIGPAPHRLHPAHQDHGRPGRGGRRHQDRHHRAADRHQRTARAAEVRDQRAGGAQRRHQPDRQEPALARGAGRSQGAARRRRREASEAGRADREAAQEGLTSGCRGGEGGQVL
jgi:uncharacterized protein involved in outer membrane biogenesis